MRRLCLVLSIGLSVFALSGRSALCAAEQTVESGSEKVATPTTNLQPVLMTVAAGDGGTISFKPNEPSKLLGGVTLGYEKIKILCDFVHYWQSPLAGVKRPVLDHAEFGGGPASPAVGTAAGRVQFDSRDSQLPQVGFRGVMQPSRVEMVRQPNADGAAKTVAYKVFLHDVGTIAGDFLTAQGWAPHSGWAEQAELIMLADITPAGVANPRFSEVILLGRPATHPQGKKGARLERLNVAIKELSGKAGADKNNQPSLIQQKSEQLTPPPAAIKPDEEKYDWWIESSRIHLIFDDMGRVQEAKTGMDTTSGGTPTLDNFLPQHDSAAPKPAVPAQ
jgi:hypothetical protein